MQPDSTTVSELLHTNESPLSHNTKLVLLYEHKLYSTAKYNGMREITTSKTLHHTKKTTANLVNIFIAATTDACFL